MDRMTSPSCAVDVPVRKIGYVHIPDMGLNGFSEFFRLYGVEAEMESLIVDVRYNGGGSVSQLLLEKLSRWKWKEVP